MKTKTPIYNQGILITTPWSNEMYAHNDKVSTLMKSQIEKAIRLAEYNEDATTLAIISKALNGYSSDLDVADLTEDALRGLHQVANHWLHEYCWDDLLKANLVTPISMSFVGYKS
jgi:hypothetical protein